MFRDKIGYLGHVVSADGIATDPKKLQAIMDWPRPQNLQNVRSFLGFVGYYRRYIPKFSSIAASLYAYLVEEGIRRRRQLEYYGMYGLRMSSMH